MTEEIEEEIENPSKYCIEEKDSNAKEVIFKRAIPVEFIDDIEISSIDGDTWNPVFKSARKLNFKNGGTFKMHDLNFGAIMKLKNNAKFTKKKFRLTFFWTG